MTSCPDEKPRMIALRRWKARRGSEKGQIEHDRADVLAGWRGRLPCECVLANYILNQRRIAFPSEEALDRYYAELKLSDAGDS